VGEEGLHRRGGGQRLQGRRCLGQVGGEDGKVLTGHEEETILLEKGEAEGEEHLAKVLFIRSQPLRQPLAETAPQGTVTAFDDNDDLLLVAEFGPEGLVIPVEGGIGRHQLVTAGEELEPLFRDNHRQKRNEKRHRQDQAWMPDDDAVKATIFPGIRFHATSLRCIFWQTQGH